MQTLVEVTFGSQLYGTATPTSDLDIKAVHIPCAKDILLQQVQDVVNYAPEKQAGQKNTAEDVDHDSYSLAKFLKLLAEGQVVAQDILFAPRDKMLADPHPLWAEVQQLAPKLFSKKAASFIRYCRKQASKYGAKGIRVAAVRETHKLLEDAMQTHGSSAKLGDCLAEIRPFVESNPHLSFGMVKDGMHSEAEFIDICGKKALLNSSVKIARDIAQKLLDEYGNRALAAEKNQGADWKALSHAVRISHQAIEFLYTHKVTFPRPEAAHLIDIKLGKLPYTQVAEEIEVLLMQVEQAILRSDLPEEVDSSIIDEFVERVHREIILKEAQA